MNCPACNHELKLLQVTGVKAHACEGSCGGLWFEWNEIKKLKDRNAAAGAELLHVERADGVHVFRDIQHPCPHCIHTLLYRHCFSRKFNYEIDQCSKCAGFWLDAGALAQLPPNAPSESNRQTAKDYFNSLFEVNLKLENLTHPDTQEAAKIIFNLFRFLTPAEYLRP
jgi:Zn-finger nucleic acid-binding protein